MKSSIRNLSLCAILVPWAAASAATTVTIDPGATWLGYMNVFNKGTPGYGAAGAGAFQFAGVWGSADLKATFTGSNLSLKANTIGDPNEYWYQNTSGTATAPNFGGPGQAGNKIMDASFYQEVTGPYAGITLTFTGTVLSNTLAQNPVDATGHGWTTVAFIKDFAPDYSSFVPSIVPLTPGVFSVSLNTINDPARHVQFGFQTIGPNVWAGDPLSNPEALITAIPEPAGAALAALGAALLGVRRRRI